MRLRVRHLVQYRFAAPVALGPHLLRLTPRGLAGGMAHGIRVSPEPAFRLDEDDLHGNRITRIGFAGKARDLTIESRLDLETTDLRTPVSMGNGATTAAVPGAGCGAAAQGPVGAGDGVGGDGVGGDGVAVRYLMRGPADPGVTATARRLRALAGPDPRAFADSLTATLHAAIAVEGAGGAEARAPRPAGETLARGRGTMRDLVALYVELSRRAGLPARFVSGYWADSPDPVSPRGARVWAEVLVPEHGWVGYDPGLGRATGTGHLALAAAPDLAGTRPVAGSTFAADIRVSAAFEIDVLTPS